MIEINVSNNYSSTIELNNELINKGSLRANEFFMTAEFATTYEELTRYVCTFNFRRNDNVEINGLVATPVQRNSKWGWFYNISSKDITALDGDLHLTIKLNNLNNEEVITTTSFTLHVERNEIGEEIVLINDAQYNALLDKFNQYYTKDAIDNLVFDDFDIAITDKEVNIHFKDGSPKGVYANLSALQTAYPSGASGVYLTSDNGHWYYWNGSAWTDGGVYQSSEDIEQIKEDIANIKNANTLNNLYVYDTIRNLDDSVVQNNIIYSSINESQIGKPIGGMKTVYMAGSKSYLIDVSKYVSVTFPLINNGASAGSYLLDTEKKCRKEVINTSEPDGTLITTDVDGNKFLLLSASQSMVDNGIVVYGLQDSDMQRTIDSVKDGSLLEFQFHNIISEKLTPMNYYHCIDSDIRKSSNAVMTDDGFFIPHGGYVFFAIDAFKNGLSTGAKIRMHISKMNNYISCLISSSVTGSAYKNLQFLNVYGDMYEVVVQESDMTADNHMIVVRLDCSAATTTWDTVFSRIEITKAGKIYFPVYASNDKAFVSADGDDAGDGSEEHPFATVNCALEHGFSTILMHGGIYEQRIDMKKLQGNTIEIRPSEIAGRVMFRSPESLVASAESIHSGKVYKATIVNAIPAQVTWIYQDGVDDASTLIQPSEKHPCQRGKYYRCEDTKIVKCSSTTLAAAITEISESDAYKWFAEGNTLYYSRPEVVSNDHPIRCGIRKPMIENLTRVHTVRMTGIESKYMSIDISQTVNSKLVDCKAFNTADIGAINYGSAVGAVMERCEAASNQYNNIGDGFNASSSNIGYPFAHQQTATMIDCWSHDNNDDGYSDHERAEMRIYGGLFEYNGKAGVTPSYGSHCVCYNVTSRRNKNGFLYAGTAEAEEGGNGGEIFCYGCIAENNDKPGSFGCGFALTGNNNRMELYDCVAVGNREGALYVESEQSSIRIHNFYAHGNGAIKIGQGIVDILNTMKIESI